MAIPLIPIVLAVAGLANGAIQGISQARNARNEAKAVQSQTKDKVNERARQARKLMSQQKTSFLKSGVYFEGTPEAVINETYDTSLEDINAMIKDTDTATNNLMRQGRTALFSSLLNGVIQGAASSFSNGYGSGNITSSGSKLKTKIQNWYNSKRGWTIGDFGGNSSNDVWMS